MFVGGYDGINRLYTNNNDGTFTAVNTGIIVTDGNYKKGCGWCDYDNDNYIDLFIATLQTIAFTKTTAMDHSPK